jgi:hypothetical protein
VRKYSSADAPDQVDPMLAIPTYWVRPSQTLSSAAGMHRFLWDLHYPAVAGVEAEYPIAAVPHNTAPQPTSPWAMPGQYTAVLTVNGKTHSQPFTVHMDPRVKATTAALAKQFELSERLYKSLLTLSPAAEEAAAARKQIGDLKKQAQGEVLTAVNALDQKLADIMGARTRRPGPGSEPPSLGDMKTRMLALLNILQETDDAPTTQATAAAAELEQNLTPLMQRWKSIKADDVVALNVKLKAAGMAEIKLD